MSNKKAVARERVKAMREEQARKDRRKEQLMRFGIVGAAIAAVAIIVFAVQASRGGDDGPAVLPTGVTEEAGGLPLASETADVPTVEVWFDFKCPHCATFEAANNTTIQELANSGAANILYRPVTWTGGSDSTRASNAWACAAEEGVGSEFKQAVFANQGAQFSNRFLIDIGESVGADGGDFRSCVNEGTYNSWVSESVAVGSADPEVGGTPTVVVDGQVLDTSQWTPEGLTAAVAAASGGGDDADADADADAEDDDDSDGE
jgi:protein-disulfide isomerase